MSFFFNAPEAMVEELPKTGFARLGELIRRDFWHLFLAGLLAFAGILPFTLGVGLTAAAHNLPASLLFGAVGGMIAGPELCGMADMEEGLRLCDEVHPDLLLGTDPDCDRTGAAVPNGKGGYRLISGNEMGALLLDYICRTLTGFKYIGEQIGLLEAEGHKERYIFGFEESYGYLSGAHVRDKDAVNAVMLACECAAWYAGQGMTLLDTVNVLYEKFGYYRNSLISIAFEGQNGMKAMDDLMKSLRADAPQEIAGRSVIGVTDYLGGDTGLIPADVLEFQLAGDAKLIVRPSGTEPKLKLYLSVKGDSEANALAALERLAEAAGDLVRTDRSR